MFYLKIIFLHSNQYERTNSKWYSLLHFYLSLLLSLFSPSFLVAWIANFPKNYSQEFFLPFPANDFAKYPTDRPLIPIFQRNWSNLLNVRAHWLRDHNWLYTSINNFIDSHDRWSQLICTYGISSTYTMILWIKMVSLLSF